MSIGFIMCPYNKMTSSTRSMRSTNSVWPNGFRNVRWAPSRGEPTYVEYRIICPDGTTRWIHDRAFSIRYPSGQVDRVAGIAEDITERNRAEAER